MNHENHPLAIVIMAFIAILSSLGAALMPAFEQASAQVADVVRMLSVMDDARLRLVCIAGSLGGAVLSVGIFRPVPPLGEFIFKVFLSTVAGVLFSPLIMRKGGFDYSTDVLLTVSGVAGLLGYGILQKTVPMAIGFATMFVGKKLDTSPYDVEDSRPHSPKPKTRPDAPTQRLSTPPPRRLRAPEEDDQ